MGVKVRFNRNFYLKIPPKIVKDLNLLTFDFCEIEEREDGFFVKPLRVIREDQVCFWSQKWQKYIHSAKEDIEKKRVLVYKDADELSEFLFRKYDTRLGFYEKREIKGRPVLKEKEGLGITHTFFSEFGYYAQEHMDKREKKKVRDIFEVMLRDPFDKRLKVEPIQGMEGEWVLPVDEKRVILFSVRDKLVFLEYGGNKEWY